MSPYSLLRDMQTCREIITAVMDEIGFPEGVDEICVKDIIRLRGIFAVGTVSKIHVDAVHPWFNGIGYGIELNPIRLLEKPVVCRGKRGWWVVPEQVERQIEGLVKTWTGRYLVFRGYIGLSKGGWGDFWDSFDTLEGARYAADSLSYDEWWHIVDSETSQIVAKIGDKS